MTTPTTAAPSDLASWIAPGRAALVIVDMQADFASPDGAMARAGVDLSSVPAALAAAETLATAARAAGVPVIFVGLMTTPETDSPAWAERARRRRVDAAAEAELCRAGSPGAAFVGPTPRPGEPVIPKLRYSAFFRTDLDAELQRLGVDTVVLCGLTTECCIADTARDACHLDYQLLIPTDAVAAYDQATHAAALRTLAESYALLTDSAAVAAAWPLLTRKAGEVSREA